MSIQQLATLNWIRENIFWNGVESYLDQRLPVSENKKQEIMSLVNKNIHAMNSSLDIQPWVKEKFGITLNSQETAIIGRYSQLPFGCLGQL